MRNVTLVAIVAALPSGCMTAEIEANRVRATMTVAAISPEPVFTSTPGPTPTPPPTPTTTSTPIPTPTATLTSHRWKLYPGESLLLVGQANETILIFHLGVDGLGFAQGLVYITDQRGSWTDKGAFGTTGGLGTIYLEIEAGEMDRTSRVVSELNSDGSAIITFSGYWRQK